MALKKVDFSKISKRVVDEMGESVDWEYTGQVIEGVYKEKKENIGEHRLSVYTIENSEGKFSVWGCHQIEKKMCDIEIGCIVRIVYKGIKQLVKGKKVKIFDILTAPIPKDFDIDNDLYQVETTKEVKNGENRQAIDEEEDDIPY